MLTPIADRTTLFARVAVLEAENKELKAWVREALPSFRCTDEGYETCDIQTCWYRRGEKLLLEGADGG